MNTLTQRDFNVVDQKLMALGIIPHNDAETLPASDTMEKWVEHRCRYISPSILNAMLAEQVGLPIFSPSALGPGFWWQGYFTPYRESNEKNDDAPALLSPVVIEGVSAPYAVLSSDHNENSISVSPTFWSLLSQYKVEKLENRIQNAQLVEAKHHISIKLGAITIPLLPLSDYAGPGSAKGRLKTHPEKESLLLWGDVFKEIMSQGQYSRIHFICGDHIDFPDSIFTTSDIRVVHCKDLTEQDVLKINGPTVIKSNATCLSELLASILHIPVYAWVEKVSSLHIRYQVPKLCNSCKKLEKNRPSFSQLHYNFSLPEGGFFVSGVGCEKCFWGYNGCEVIEEKVTLDNKGIFLKAIHEYVKKSEGKRELNVYEIYSSAHEAKYHTTFAAVSKLVATGNVSIDDIAKQIF